MPGDAVRGKQKNSPTSSSQGTIWIAHHGGQQQSRLPVADAAPRATRQRPRVAMAYRQHDEPHAAGGDREQEYGSKDKQGEECEQHASLYEQEMVP
jgi:hypothetical protein